MAQDSGGTQRRLSNIGHWAEGALFAALGVLALLQVSGSVGGRSVYASPVLLIGAGVFLPAFLFGHGHGSQGHAKQIAADPQQRQHLVMAALLFISGLAELALVAGWIMTIAASYVFPAALAIIGIMFMLHTQHGDHAAMAKAVRFHRLLGMTILLSGVSRAIALHQGRGFAYASAVLLLVVAALLVTYREPQGAYTGGDSQTRGHGGH